MIGAGDEWKGAIDKNLEDAQLILLLVSNVFPGLGLLLRHRDDAGSKASTEAEMARVIPVILRECLWQESPFARFHPIPEGPQGRDLVDEPGRSVDRRGQGNT